MSRIVLGTAQFGLPYGIANLGGQVTRSMAEAMLIFAASKGIDMLDTAIAYGESEACLGEVGAGSFRVVTKLPAVPDDCADVSLWVQQQVGGSLARLRVSVLHGLLLHRPDQLLGKDGNALYQALQNLKAAGQVKKVGISIYAPGELEALIPRYQFDLVQAPLNLVDRRLCTTGWLQRLKNAGVEVHTRSAFLQGLLLMPQGAIPRQFSPWTDLWRKWHQWLAQHNVSAVQACLAFPLSFPEIDRVVVGADSVIHLEQIMSAAARTAPLDFPELRSEAESLINPAQWSQL